MTCGAHVGPTIFYYIMSKTDMWVPWGLIFFHIKLPRHHHVNATWDEDLVKGSHVGATSSKTGHNTTEGPLLHGFVTRGTLRTWFCDQGTKIGLGNK